MSQRSLRLINDQEAISLLDLDRAYDAIRDAYVQAATLPPVLSSPSAQLMKHPSAPAVAMKVKGAQLPSQRVAGFRLVGDFDAEGGEISHDFQWLADMDTAMPYAMVEMLTLHTVRTAITGVVALEAIHGSGAKRIALIGAGKIADQAVAVLRRRFALDEIRVAASRSERAVAFAANHCGNVVGCASIDEAIGGAEAVLSITSASSPILFGAQLRPGMTLVGMGGSYECDLSMLEAADRFYVDDMNYACVSGSLGAWVKRGLITAQAAQARVNAELGQIVGGLARVERSPTDRVFTIVQGMACCDLALAADIAARAAERGIGRVVGV